MKYLAAHRNHHFTINTGENYYFLKEYDNNTFANGLLKYVHEQQSAKLIDDTDVSECHIFGKYRRIILGFDDKCPPDAMLVCHIYDLTNGTQKVDVHFKCKDSEQNKYYATNPIRCNPIYISSTSISHPIFPVLFI